jgi:hypothetical protein
MGGEGTLQLFLKTDPHFHYQELIKATWEEEAKLLSVLTYLLTFGSNGV